jgi:hypothetical protein
MKYALDFIGEGRSYRLALYRTENGEGNDKINAPISQLKIPTVRDLETDIGSDLPGFCDIVLDQVNANQILWSRAVSKEAEKSLSLRATNLENLLLR